MSSPSFLVTKRVRRFHKFFELGLEESLSPFLSEEGKKLSQNLLLKGALFSALLLLVAFVFRQCSCQLPISFLLSIIYLLVGSPALVAFLEDVFIKKDVNIDVLMTLAAFGALLSGYAMEGAFLLVLFEISQALEGVLTMAAKRSLAQLEDLNPEKAVCVEEDGSLFDRALADVAVGQVVLVRCGEVVPIDGVVVSGQASCSLGHLSGEELPVLYTVGSLIASGARVVEGGLYVKTQVLSHQSTLASLVSLITQAHIHKPTLSQTFDVYGRMYSMSVIALTALLAGFLPVIIDCSFFGRGGSLQRAMTFLMAASPCALILAIPISYLSALGAALKKGVIVKGGIVLDRLMTCENVVFDKTGTLTYGTFEIESCERLCGDFPQESALGYLASLEQYSTHPIAKAIVEYARRKSYRLRVCEKVQLDAGKGISGLLQEKKKTFSLFAGSFAYIREMFPNFASIIDQAHQDIFIELFFVIDDSCFVCHLQDVTRQESSSAVSLLKRLGKKVFLLSGDRKQTVEKIAKKLGVTGVWSEAKPEEKVRVISTLSSQGVAMVGDGLNDAPALAHATVGISMGAVASESAREVAQVVLLHDALNLLPWLFEKASRTRVIVFQNIVFAFFAILVGVIFSISGMLPLWGAVLLHEGSTLLVGLNGLRLLRLS